MDYQIELVLKKPIESHRLLLDCQSFINGLHFQKFSSLKWNDVWFLMMEGNDCEYASEFSKQSSQNNELYCLIVDPEERSMDFNANLSDCN